MDGGATALAPSDSQSTSLGLGKSKGSGKKKRLPLRLVRSAVRVCLDTVEFVRDRMTALKLKPKKRKTKRKTTYNHKMQAVPIIALGEERL